MNYEMTSDKIPLGQSQTMWGCFTSMCITFEGKDGFGTHMHVGSSVLSFQRKRFENHSPYCLWSNLNSAKVDKSKINLLYMHILHPTKQGLIKKLMLPYISSLFSAFQQLSDTHGKHNLQRLQTVMCLHTEILTFIGCKSSYCSFMEW